MDRLKAIVIDDEEMARRALERLCAKSERIELLDSFEDAKSVLKFMESESVDLLFLDIEMPELSGIQLLDQLNYLPQVIFTTANKEYAFEAYEYDVTDFIKKPISLQRFIKAVDKAVLRQDALHQINEQSQYNEIYVKADGKLTRIPISQIHYFENAGDYVLVVSDLGKHIISGTIKGVDAKLKSPRLIKVHRSFIINLDHVKDIEDNSVLVDSKIIPISRAHKSILMNHLNIL